MLTSLIVLALGILLAMLLASIIVPRVVEYVEETEIAAPAAQVHEAIRQQSVLMRWSAWPSETGSDCSVTGTDGEVGARTVFLDRQGRQFGFQEITAVTPGIAVSFLLQSKGPPHKPTMVFYTIPQGAQRTRVLLAFRNDITPPFHVLLRVFGIVRWTRDMHRKDLDGLRRYCERGETYTGEPAGVVPEAATIG